MLMIFCTCSLMILSSITFTLNNGTLSFVTALLLVGWFVYKQKFVKFGDYVIVTVISSV